MSIPGVYPPSYIEIGNTEILEIGLNIFLPSFIILISTLISIPGLDLVSEGVLENVHKQKNKLTTFLIFYCL